MTDKEFALQKRRIKKAVDRWIKPLGLLWWVQIDIVYHRTKTEMAFAVGRPQDAILDCIAEVKCSWKYLKAAINWNCSVTTEMTDEELDSTARHELAHLMVNELCRWEEGDTDGPDHEEHVCTRLAQAFKWVRDAGRKEGQRKRKR